MLKLWFSLYHSIKVIRCDSIYILASKFKRVTFIWFIYHYVYRVLIIKGNILVKVITPIQFEVKDIFIFMPPDSIIKVILIEQENGNFDISHDKHCNF